MVTKRAYKLLFNVEFEARVELISLSVFGASMVDDYFEIGSIKYYRYNLLQILESINILFINIWVINVSFKLSVTTPLGIVVISWEVVRREYNSGRSQNNKSSRRNTKINSIHN